MAIYHLQIRAVSRSNGDSAVAVAAHRAGKKLTDARTGITHDFTRLHGVEHLEIVAPQEGQCALVHDRQMLWNAAEAAEKRRDSRVAREIEVSLPHEINGEQRIELSREFAQALADRYHVAADLAVHLPPEEGNPLNHHAHILLTTRHLSSDGLAGKSDFELTNTTLIARDCPTSYEQIKLVRSDWEKRVNNALEHAGLNIRVDHRSHRDRGIDIAPTQHIGVVALRMKRRGKVIEREQLDPRNAVYNGDAILKRPERILAILACERPVFSEADILGILQRYILDPNIRHEAATTVMASPFLIRVAENDRTGHPPKGAGPLYTVAGEISL